MKALAYRLIAIVLLSATTLHAANQPAPSSAPITNSSLIGEHYRQVLQRPEFQAPTDLDADSRLKDWLSQWFLHLGTKLGEFQYEKEMRSFSLLLMALLLTLTLAGLLYIAFRLSRGRGSHEELSSTDILGHKKLPPPEYYDEEIRRAIAAGNWHAAWLVTWRQFLSRLENRRLVEADRTRTNREYLAQLRRQSLPSPAYTLLARMVDAYDRFIYGRKTIQESDWNQFHQQIDEAALLLHLNEKISRLDDKRPAT